MTTYLRIETVHAHVPLNGVELLVSLEHTAYVSTSRSFDLRAVCCTFLSPLLSVARVKVSPCKHRNIAFFSISTSDENGGEQISRKLRKRITICDHAELIILVNCINLILS